MYFIYIYIFKTKILINAAGLGSFCLAQKINKLKDQFIPNVNFYKGNYFKLIGKSPFDRLIYPLPKKITWYSFNN